MDLVEYQPFRYNEQHAGEAKLSIMHTKNSGVTLIELLIAMAVGMVVLSAVYAVYTLQNKLLANQDQLSALGQNARIAMDVMVREIIMAGYNQTSASCSSPVTAVRRCTGTTTATNTPCVGITSAGADTISFVADINSNCDTTADTANPNENITYAVYSPGGVPSLGRTSNGSQAPVAENVASLSLVYYDRNGAVTANLANIRKIKIAITSRTSKEDLSYTHPTFGDHYRRYTLESLVVPWNLGLAN
jgi:type IV pilus assembly protein PilW